MSKAFDDFVNELYENGYMISQENLGNREKFKLGKIWENVTNFLDDTKLAVSSEGLNDVTKPLEKVNDVITLKDIGANQIVALVESCGIPQHYVIPATEAVAACIEKYKTGSDMALADHFASGEESIDRAMTAKSEIRDLGEFCNQSFLNTAYLSTPNAALEAFGVSSNNTIVDAKLAISVTIMKFVKGIMPRLLPNRPTETSVIIFEVDRKEAYDFEKSGADSAEDRYNGNHRIPFIEFYKNPTKANVESLPLVPKDSNDTAADLVFQDGYLNFGKKANLFDLAKDPAMPATQYVDYTDLVSEGVKLESVLIKMDYDDGAGDTRSDIYEFDVKELHGSRFVMTANSADSSDRVCTLSTNLGITDSTDPIVHGANTIADILDANTFINVELNANGTINLKTSNITVLGSVAISLKTIDGSTPAAAIQTLFDNITSAAVIAYKVDARRNEENIRTTSMAVRWLNKTFGYELPGTRNVLLTMSLRQTRPDKVVTGLSEMLRIGLDDKGIKAILNTMNRVYTLYQQELVTNPSYDERLINQFVAGNKVKPYIYIDTIDISADIQFMRSAEQLADLRGVAEKKLLEIMTMIYNNSYYIQALGPGQRPVFKVLTSGYILDALLNVPYYKTIEDQPAAEKSGDDVIEYRRMLSNGTELQVITTTFDYLSDKMIIVPVIPTDPQSDLNFGQLYTMGTFVAQITAFMNRAGFKEIIANEREFPIPTNPIGAILTVSKLNTVFSGIGNLGI